MGIMGIMGIILIIIMECMGKIKTHNKIRNPHLSKKTPLFLINSNRTA
jgi:hypothetical protein